MNNFNYFTINMYILLGIVILIILYFIFNGKYREKIYFSEWEKIRKLAFEKHGYYCSKCGIIENLDVHHKIPKSLGGLDNLDNLIVLCRKHHEEEHGYNFNDNQKKSRTVTSKNMKIIIDSIYNGDIIEIVYKSHYDNKKTKRKIRVIELYKKNYKSKRGYIGYHWIIRTYCYLKNGERNFYIKDIQEIINKKRRIN